MLQRSRINSVWVKIKVKIDKLRKEKSMKQIKDKLWNLRDLYKQAKGSNKKTGRSPVFSPYYYQDFDEILGTRDVICLQHSREVGVTREISNTEIGNEDTGGKISIFLCYPCLPVKMTPFLSSIFGGYFRFFSRFYNDKNQRSSYSLD